MIVVTWRGQQPWHPLPSGRGGRGFHHSSQEWCVRPWSRRCPARTPVAGKICRRSKRHCRNHRRLPHHGRYGLPAASRSARHRRFLHQISQRSESCGIGTINMGVFQQYRPKAEIQTYALLAFFQLVAALGIPISLGSRVESPRKSDS